MHCGLHPMKKPEQRLSFPLQIGCLVAEALECTEYLVSRRQFLGRSSLVKHGGGQLPVEPAAKSASIFSAVTLWPAWLATFVFIISNEFGVSLVENNTLSEPSSVLQWAHSYCLCGFPPIARELYGVLYPCSISVCQNCSSGRFVTWMCLF